MSPGSPARGTFTTPPAGDDKSAFDSKAFAQKIVSDLAGKMDVDEGEGEGGEKQLRGEDVGGEEAVAKKRPRFDSKHLVEEVDASFQEGVVAQLAAQKAKFQQKSQHQAEEMEKLKAQFESMSKAIPAAASSGGAGDFRKKGQRPSGVAWWFTTADPLGP